MVYHPNALTTTERLREMPQDAQMDFPYTAILSDLESYADRCSSWHWHEHFEFATVSGGEMELCTQRQSLRIGDGEGYFVNSNVLHLCRAADGSEHVQLQVHQFDRGLVGNSSCVLRSYVQPVQDCGGLDALKLTPGDGTQREILNTLKEAFLYADEEPAGYELSVSIRLMQAWEGLYKLAEPLIRGSGRVSAVESERIKEMLAFIHGNYGEAITIPMIAASANICAREAFRCFRQVLGTTPAIYLMRHRVNAAARQLIETNRSVTEISADCGFSTPSYFCRVFHDIIGQSPREFRRQANRKGEP